MSVLHVKLAIRIWLLIILWSCLSGVAAAQHVMTGQVLDRSTGESLAFVNIVINGDARQGATSDIHGRFRLNASSPIHTLTFSYVGYDKLTIDVAPGDIIEDRIFYLNASAIALGEVVVRAGENPANRIIREVIRNKDRHDPRKIDAYRYTSYNKVVYDFEAGSTALDSGDLAGLDSVFRGGHFLVMESLTERNFVRPNHSEEIVLATRVSGFKSASFAPLATDVQPFSFYEDIITVIDIDYLNPISDGSLSKYEFHIRDTLYQDVDTVYILSFKPLPGRNFEALTGLLYVHTNGYAIQHVIAKPHDRGFVDVNLQQQYRLVDGKQWFPEQLKFELIIRNDKAGTVGVRASGISLIEDVVLSQEIEKRNFALEEVHLHPLANDRDSLYWATRRPVPLDSREQITYEVLDSLGEKFKFDNKLKILERLGQGKLPVGILDVDFDRILAFNQYEGVRLGLGVYTNDKLIRNLALGGYGGYGFRDHTWKFGTEAILKLDATGESEIRVGYHDGLRETGSTRLGIFRPRQFDFRTFLASRMDHMTHATASVGFRVLRYMRLNASFNRMTLDPRYAYAFQPDDQAPVTDYVNTDVALTLRYAHKERLIRSMGQRISMGTDFPVLTLAYSRGLKDVLDGRFDYQKMEARLEYSLRFPTIGKSSIRVDAGLLDTSLPYGLLFTGEGSFVRNWSVLVRNSFMTAEPYEFLSDRFVNVHFAHAFGSLLFHIGNWRPSVTVFQNMGWGSLENPAYHQQVAFQTKEKGLFESGLQLDNLVKFNYLNVSYIGIGAGAFFRYGPYASGHFGRDAVFTLSMTFTTK